MKRVHQFMMLFATMMMAGITVFGARSGETAQIRIIPQPEKVIPQKGEFQIKGTTVFFIQNQQLKNVAGYLNKKLTLAAGLSLKTVTQQPSGNYIALLLDPAVKSKEGYQLNVSSGNITIKGSTTRGIFYGVQTLLQLLPAQIESPVRTKVTKWAVPCIEVVDSPRFAWRGMLLDVCRHFYSVDFIKKQLDVMAMYKMNVLHWHLTEDQGWRIEIKKYPLLTAKGAYRVEGDGKTYGGYYTQAQIREIVKYAKDRYINILPEVEMPGHALAALTAYPQYSCTGGPFKVRNIWGVEPDIYCAGKEETFKFIDDILSEVIPLFPFKYIHIGGDEAPKDRWKVCPNCQKRIKDNGLKDEAELQSYFVKRIEKLLEAKGRKMIGWDEILEGGIAPSATIMSWRGEAGGIEAANQGHDVIMTPGEWVYLDHFQGDTKVEPVEIGGYTTLEKSYSYDPIPKDISPAMQHHILGSQANIWTEYMYTPEVAEHMIYPRLIALAEVDWSPKGSKDFSRFLTGMDNQYKRLDLHKISYAIPMPEGPGSSVAFMDTVSLSFHTTRPVKMVYTLNGSDPNATSAIYTEPLHFDKTTTLKIRSVLSTGEMSRVRTIRVVKETLTPAVEKETTSGLNMRLAIGTFLKVADLAKAQKWETSVISVMSSDKFNYMSPSAAIFEGYVDIPEDGVYFFSSDVDQVWVAGKLIVNNDGQVKRYSRNEGSIALAKGKHAFKSIYLNNIIGGWPSSWNEIKVNYRKSSQSNFEEIPASAFSH